MLASRLARFARTALFAAAALACGGCTSLRYVTQAAVGQEDLELRARDIDELLRDGRVDKRTGDLLAEVTRIKRFGEEHGLTATANYTKYVRVDGPAVVWVVSASDPLAFKSKEWSFPIVGSFTYLGWFDKREAQSFARDLRNDGWDVDLRGSGAYSTRGYFEDPVLSTMIDPGPEALGELANVILHESAHATFFVADQSTLNESVAEFVGDGLAIEYVKATRGDESDEMRSYLKVEERSKKRKRAMRAAYDALTALYASPRSRDDKLAEKRALLMRLRTEIGMKREITNATLIQMRTYNSGQSELGDLLGTCGGSWRRFVLALARLESPNPPGVPWFAKEQEGDVGPSVKKVIALGCPVERMEQAPALPANMAGSSRGPLDRANAGR